MRIKNALKFMLMTLIVFGASFLTSEIAGAENAGEMRFVPEEKYWTYKAVDYDEEDVPLENSIVITGYDDNTGVDTRDYDTPCYLVVPREIQGKKVVGIDIETYRSHYMNIVSLELPDTVMSIALSEFFALKHLTLPDSIKYVKDHAFFKCEFLDEINIPEGVIEIGSYAFYGCVSLKKISLPRSLEELSDETVFADCRSLEKITVEAGNTKYYDLDGVLFYNMTYYDYIDSGKVDEDGYPIEDVIEKQYRAIITYPAGKSGEFTIEDDMRPVEPCVTFLNAAGLTAIHVTPGNMHYTSIDGILYTKDLKYLYACPAGKTGALTVPDGVEVIDTNAFSYSSLSSMVISDSVQYMGGYQFYESTKLTSIHFGKSLENMISLERIPNLETVTISQENQHYTVRDNVVYDKQLSEMIDIPGGFHGKLTIPDSVTELSFDAGDGNVQISELHIGKSISANALLTKGDEENDPEIKRSVEDLLRVSESFTVSEENAELKAVDGTLFSADMKALIASKKAESLVIPDGVTTIYTDGIKSTLKTIIIPKSVVNFWGSRIDDVNTIYGYAGSAAEEYAKKNSIVFIPMSVQPSPTRKPSSGSSSATKKSVFLAKAKTFTYGDFKYKVTDLVKENAPVKVAVIGLSKTGKKKTCINVKNAFSYAGNSCKVTQIAGSKAFKNSPKLKKAVLGSKIKCIPANAFSGCKKLSNISAAGITKISQNAFKNCKALKKLNLRKKVSVKKGAFKGCKNTIIVTGGTKKINRENVKRLKKSGYNKFK